MQRTVAERRLLVAALHGKEEELTGQVYQFRRQLDHASAAAIRGSSIEASLSIMSEIQERLDDVQRTREHLNAIKIRAQDELQALELTSRVEQAKDRIHTLRESEGSSEAASEETRREIGELEGFVEEARIRAGQAITGGL